MIATFQPTTTATPRHVTGGTLNSETLLAFLDAQRAGVLAIVADLSPGELTKAALPSGWTPLGMIEHLGYAERHWFQEVATGTAQPLPWPEEDMLPEGAPFVTSRPPEVVFAFYRQQIDVANALLATTPLSSAAVGRHGDEVDDRPVDLNYIVLHIIEETARHAGHLDIARELLDGRTGLGPR